MRRIRRTDRQPDIQIAPNWSKLVLFATSRAAVFALALSGCADRPIGDETSESSSSTVQSSEVGSGVSSSELPTSTTFLTDSGNGDTATDSTNTSGTTGMDTGTTADVCEAADPLCQEKLSPEMGPGSPCLSSDDLEQCKEEGGICLWFGSEPDFAVCGTPCTQDSDCGCAACGAVPKCIGPRLDPETQKEVSLCFLGCDLNLEQHLCPGKAGLDPSPLHCVGVNGLFENDEFDLCTYDPQETAWNKPYLPNHSYSVADKKVWRAIE